MSLDGEGERDGQRDQSRDGRTLSEQAYARIKRDILNGTLLPDEKLQIEAVSERYGIGAVPVREALNRLSSEGIVERKSQRGFFVAGLSMAELEELVTTRIWLETRALAEAIEHGDEAWEERLVLACHRLSRIHRNLPVGEENRALAEEWEVRHKEYHLLLLEPCGSRWLIGFCASMMDQAERYRSLSMNVTVARRSGAPEEHKAILDAVIDRDAPRACRLLSEHYRATLEGLRGVLGERGTPAAG